MRLPDNLVVEWLPLLPENHVDSACDDDSDIVEPDQKQLRLTDGYEIDLAVMEIPRTYKEAMASPKAAEWKESVRGKLRSHFSNHTWDTIHRPDGVRLIWKNGFLT
ncbi:hypothetical protein PsorP6_016600 [Peronosclerospora sorghi]|uniref:Uncharacterized protein n=1 Tax=Peronosclerospora sorghi TaxID=230839 RepID=A0ACC0VJJ2_9STRA|nr:hypothetical protein PsorP6_016600 [Peronosclerospora sorghi]